LIVAIGVDGAHEAFVAVHLHATVCILSRGAKVASVGVAQRPLGTRVAIRNAAGRAAAMDIDLRERGIAQLPFETFVAIAARHPFTMEIVARAALVL
jgi:hypothetical protein